MIQTADAGLAFAVVALGFCVVNSVMVAYLYHHLNSRGMFLTPEKIRAINTKSKIVRN